MVRGIRAAVEGRRIVEFRRAPCQCRPIVLRPNLAAGAWEVLLLQIRRHLELQTPLDAEIQVQLNDGHIEWWRMQGSAERNPGGQPVRLAGSVRDISAERRRLAADSQPAA